MPINNENHNKSEVAQLRAQIDLEIDALSRFRDPAMVASHAMITRRFRNLERHTKALARYVGEEQATAEVCERYGTL